MTSRLTSEGLCLDEYASNDTYANVHCPLPRTCGSWRECD